MKCEERKICVIYKVIQLKKEETPIESATAKADRKKGFKYRVFNMCLSLRNFCNTCRGLYFMLKESKSFLSFLIIYEYMYI